MSDPALLPSRVGPLVVRRGLSVLLSVIAIVLGVVAGAAAFLLGLFAGLPVAIVLGAVALAAVTWILTALAHRAWRSPQPGPRKALRARRSPFLIAGAVLVAVGVLAGTTVLAPVSGASAFPDQPKPQYWDLETGSRIAYWKSDSPKADSSATPIIFVHGGPGGYNVAEDIDYFQSLSASGQDVYIYDQPGTGRSSNLPVDEYTVERWVADLDAIREEVGAEKVDLIGHSAGGYVVETYAAAHPDRTAHVALISPGGYDRSAKQMQDEADEQAALEEKHPEVAEAAASPELPMSSRTIAAILIGDVLGYGPAQNLLGQDDVKREVHRSLGAPLNIYVNQVLTVDFVRTTPDTLTRLSELDVPTLLVRSENDYVPWADQVHYLAANERSETVYVEEASHSTWVEQPKTVRAALEAFFADRPQPAGTYDGTDNPVFSGARGATD